MIAGIRARLRGAASALFGRDVPSMPVDAESYVRMAYLVLLRRPVDTSGLENWRGHISAGRFTRQYVIDAILQSDEYLSSFGVDVIGVVHRSRQAWIRTIPRFERILDIGGSSANLREGALIELGYPHRPRQIDIVDLPPERQYWGKPTYDQTKSSTFPWGEVSYFHGSAETVGQISELQCRLYDGVFLGQSIEHIQTDAIAGLLSWIRAHLAEGGQLVLDTPNRLLTKIQCPGSLIDPDHKYEYTPDELQSIIERAGFLVTRRTGMVRLSEQAMSGKYSPSEFATAELLSDDADACYLFALEARPA